MDISQTYDWLVQHNDIIGALGAIVGIVAAIFSLITGIRFWKSPIKSKTILRKISKLARRALLSSLSVLVIVFYGNSFHGVRAE